MYKSILGVILGCGVSVSALAGSGMATALELGYRVDNFDWNIAGDINGQNPNIISELQWTSMQIPQAKLDVDLWLSNYYLRGSFGYGEVENGDNQDSDYLGDNRTLEFSRSNNDGGGEVADASVGFGYKIDTSDEHEKRFRSYIMPMVGYSKHTQDWTMTNAMQTVASASTPPLGSFGGLNSTYDAEWDGAWIGLVFGEESASLDMSMELSVTYHVVDYEAEANWNLRTDFAHPKSYDHITDGSGLTFSLNGRTAFGHSRRLFWAYGLDYRRWQTDAGVTTFYLSNNTTAQQQLNEVNWESTAVNLGLEYRM